MKSVMRFAMVVCLISCLLLSGCSTGYDTEDNKMKVTATFFPLYDLVREITRNTAHVHSVVPLSMDPHLFEPTPIDIGRLHDSQVFVTLGVSFEQFERELITNVAHDPVIVHAGSEVALLDSVDEDQGFDGDLDFREREYSGDKKDPHIWLSIRNMKKMAIAVRDGLSQANPSLADVYRMTTDDVVERLDALDNEFMSSLANCKYDTIVVTHNAFVYLARDYGFNSVSVPDLPEVSDFKTEDVRRLVEEAKKHELKYVFSEEDIDPRLSQIIDDEIEGGILRLSPLERTEDPSEGYFDLMTANLNNLKVALECLEEN